MTIKSLLLAGTVAPGLMLWPMAALAAPETGLRVAQAAPEQDKDKDKKPPARPQPPKPPQPPAAQPPQAPKPQPPAAQPAQPQRTQQPATAPSGPVHPPAAARPAPSQRQPAAQAPAGQPPSTLKREEPRDDRRDRRDRPQQPAQQAPLPQQPPPVRQQTQPLAPQPAQPPAARQPTTQPPAASTAPAASTPPATVRRLDDFRNQRREVREGDRTIIQEPGRTIIRDGGRLVIQRNEVERFRAGARDVRTERRGAENFTFVERPGGVRIITITDDNGRLLRRVRRDASGREVVLIDNTRRGAIGAGMFVNVRPPMVRIPRDRYIVEADRSDRVLIYEALIAPPVDMIERAYTLDEIRYSDALRDRMPRVDIDTVTFETGSWEVTPDQARRLDVIASALLQAIQRNPNEVFLIEGHTDAVGTDVDNLSLSDRRAESVATVLTEQFGIPPENLTTQGYGEQYLKVPTQGPERRNRRVTVRRITPLLEGLAARR